MLPILCPVLKDEGQVSIESKTSNLVVVSGSFEFRVGNQGGFVGQTLRAQGYSWLVLKEEVFQRDFHRSSMNRKTVRFAFISKHLQRNRIHRLVRGRCQDFIEAWNSNMYPFRLGPNLCTKSIHRVFHG